MIEEQDVDSMFAEVKQPAMKPIDMIDLSTIRELSHAIRDLIIRYEGHHNCTVTEIALEEKGKGPEERSLRPVVSRKVAINTRYSPIYRWE